MKILQVAPEAAPFVKTGGLGDVLGALPQRLAKLGHEVKLILPFYSQIDPAVHSLSLTEIELDIPVGDRSFPLRVYRGYNRRFKVEYFFLHNESLFDRPEPYRDIKTGKDYIDNDERFAFFSRAALETAAALRFVPDVIHVHDWQTGLIPAYLKTIYTDDEFFAGTKSLLTIHNLAYQGSFEAERYARLGLPDELFYATGPYEFWGKVNFLKGAIHFADAITTVSERYALEIQKEGDELGCGLDGVLRDRTEDLHGILNGVDYTVWSPSRDHKIPFQYYPANLSGKRDNKAELLKEAGLPLREKTLVIGIVSRLADQKGFDLLEKAAERLMKLDIQLVLLGTGEKKYHTMFEELETAYPEKVKAFLTFDDRLAHLIEAGADVFLMPSRYEPCGLNQMYSLKYGTPPIVRETGGLADTVVDYDAATGEGTGFVFEEYTAEAMLEAIERAVEAFSGKRVWKKIMKAGMSQDFSWDRAAEQYTELYRKVISG